MNNRLKLSTAAVLSGLMLGGCTTHYRESLEAYRAAEPSPFYQRTLEWTEHVPEAPEPEASVTASEAVDDPDVLTAPVSDDRSTVVAARVLGVSPDAFSAEADTLRDTAARDQALAGRPNLRTVLLATALHSPRVDAAQRTWQATVKQYSQAEYLEGLLQAYKVFTRYLEVDPGAPMQKDMNQTFFPYPSTLAYRGELIREQVRLAELAWEQALRDTLIEVGTAFVEYVFQYDGGDTVQENISLLEDLVGVVQERYAAGLATQPDVLRLQGELERQRKLHLDFLARRRAGAAQLNALLGRDADAPLGRPSANVSSKVPATAGALIATALEHRQEVRAQQARVDRTEIAIRMGEIMNRPLFSKGYSTLDRGMMPEAATGVPQEPFGSRPDVAMELPDYAQAEAYLSEMRENLASERANLTQILLETRALARTLLEETDIARRQSVLLRDVVLPLLQSAYEISVNNYKVGAVSFIDLIDAERKLTEARLELDQNLRDQHQAALRVASVRGFLDAGL